MAIHYIKNDSSIDRDDLVLVDCGCDLHGYVSDVTRTWPVCGKCVVFYVNLQVSYYEPIVSPCKS